MAKHNEQLECGLPPRPALLDQIKPNLAAIHAWLKSQEQAKELPLYSSVDLRDAGFKMSVVDTNLFPGGFNNLCEHGIADSEKFLKEAILKRVPHCKNILVVAEEHTRNTWYLENIRILQEIITRAGFNVKVATFLSVQPAFCEKLNFIQLETATGHPVQIYCFNRILEEIKNGTSRYDLIILNNDLTTGIPEVLRDTDIPIYPSIQAGWHSRLKSHHFTHTADLIKEFGQMIGMDPWLFSCLYTMVDEVNINEERDRLRLRDAAEELFAKIRAKYSEHQIKEKPFIFLKSDSGTYGMGVLPIESPDDIIALNRKNRNQLYKGKGSQVISRFLLQEGVPSILNIDDYVSEVCIYQIANNVVGGFYRSNTEKNSRQNLNSQGMEFKTMCPHLSKYGECGVRHDINVFDIYRILARIAGIAAHREIIQLEEKVKAVKVNG